MSVIVVFATVPVLTELIAPFCLTAACPCIELSVCKTRFDFAKSARKPMCRLLLTDSATGTCRT
jgi:hypothetical protein